MLSLDLQYKSLYVYTDLRTKQKKFSYQKQGKRVIDIFFSILVTVTVLSWMIPLVGILIQLESRGPILYIQKRTGYKGRWFYCLKFRTMKHNPEASFNQAKRNDHRVTTIGRFLRKTNLDEMPQFLNVLVGDMSLVGPRPHALQHSAQFWNIMPDYQKRYRIKPGITGLAQVSGCRGETDQLIKMQHRVKYDRFYSRKKSFKLDMWLCWKTLKAMIAGNVNVW